MGKQYGKKKEKTVPSTVGKNASLSPVHPHLNSLTIEQIEKKILRHDLAVLKSQVEENFQFIPILLIPIAAAHLDFFLAILKYSFPREDVLIPSSYDVAVEEKPFIQFNQVNYFFWFSMLICFFLTSYFRMNSKRLESDKKIIDSIKEQPKKIYEIISDPSISIEQLRKERDKVNADVALWINITNKALRTAALKVTPFFEIVTILLSDSDILSNVFRLTVCFILFCYLVTSYTRNGSLGKLDPAGLKSRATLNNNFLTQLNNLINGVFMKHSEWKLLGDDRLPDARFLLCVNPKQDGYKEYCSLNGGGKVYILHFFSALKKALDDPKLFFSQKNRSITIFHALTDENILTDVFNGKKNVLREELEKASDLYRTVNNKRLELETVTREVGFHAAHWIFLQADPNEYQEDAKNKVIFILNLPAQEELAHSLKKLFGELCGENNVSVYGAQLTISGTASLEKEIKKFDFAALNKEFERFNQPIPPLASKKEGREDESSDEEQDTSSPLPKEKKNWLNFPLRFIRPPTTTHLTASSTRVDFAWSNSHYNKLTAENPNGLRKLTHGQNESSAIYWVFFHEKKLARCLDSNLLKRFSGLFHRGEFATHNLNKQGFKFHPDGTLVLKRCGKSGRKEIKGQLVAMTMDPDVQPPQPLYVFDSPGPH